MERSRHEGMSSPHEPKRTEINGCDLCSYLQVLLNLLEFTMC